MVTKWRVSNPALPPHFQVVLVILPKPINLLLSCLFTYLFIIDTDSWIHIFLNGL